MASCPRRRCSVPLVMATVLSAGAAYGYYEYATRWGAIQSWLAAKPGLTRVDLSRPGVVDIHLPDVPEVHHHGYSIYLDPGCEPAPDQLPRGEVRVADGPGEPVVIGLADALRVEPQAGGRFLLSTLGRPAAGCTVTVRVEDGAPALAGSGSVVHARYRICEMVALPALLWALGAWVLGVPAAVLWGVAFWRVARGHRPVA